jgi:hypothetical protein
MPSTEGTDPRQAGAAHEVGPADVLVRLAVARAALESLRAAVSVGLTDPRRRFCLAAVNVAGDCLTIVEDEAGGR